MKRAFIAAALFLGFSASAMAQEFIRVCIPSPNVNTSSGCIDGWTPGQQSALSTTVTNIKTVSGQVGNILCYNPNTTVAFVQFFDALAANVTLGTTAPKYFVPVPPALNGGYTSLPGLKFITAISFAATTTPTGNTANGSALNCSYGYN